MSLSSLHSISTPITNLSHQKAICAEFPDAFEPPSGLPSERDMEQRKINLLNLNGQLSGIIVSTA